MQTILQSGLRNIGWYQKGMKSRKLRSWGMKLSHLIDFTKFLLGLVSRFFDFGHLGRFSGLFLKYLKKSDLSKKLPKSLLRLSETRLLTSKHKINIRNIKFHIWNLISLGSYKIRAIIWFYSKVSFYMFSTEVFIVWKA